MAKRLGKVTVEVVCVVAALAVLVVGLSSSSAYQCDVPNCPSCSNAAFDQTAIFGGQECAHGPELDVDCPDMNPANCWEINGNETVPTAPGGDGKCECFDCAAGAANPAQNLPAGVCEGYAWVHVAQCDKDKTGHCPRKSGPGPAIEWYDSVVVGGGTTCNHTSTGPVVEVLYCGGHFPDPTDPQETGGAYGNCITKDCAKGPNLVSSAPAGTEQVCDPAPW